MAKARALDKRRKSIRNIRKITRTMELIATARFKKAMDRAAAATSYTRRITQLVADLVAIDSINPDLVPGAAGEAEAAHYVAQWMRRAGLEVQIDEPAPGRPSPAVIQPICWAPLSRSFPCWSAQPMRCFPS